MSLTKRELDTLRKNLPENGYFILSQKFNKSEGSIKKILTEPQRYKKEIVDGALDLIEEHTQSIAKSLDEQKSRIQKLKK